jgi:hypothetical protein
MEARAVALLVWSADMYKKIVHCTVCVTTELLLCSHQITTLLGFALDYLVGYMTILASLWGNLA